MSRIAFLVCHLTGTGHLVRILALARAVRAAGAEALVISGGPTPAHLDTGEVVALPPLHVRDFDYSTLRDAAGRPATDAYLARRRRRIETAIAEFAPQALVTELYPLGRRRLASEFMAAIGALRRITPAAAVIASVRDIPEPPSKPARIAEAVERLRADYDAVLVHGDADFLPLSTTWPLPAELGGLVHHTGYVADPPPVAARRGRAVLVSVGGGVLGRRLLEIAAAAGAGAARPWHLLVGGPDGPAVAARLARAHPAPSVTIEPARPDYPALLAGAACSVSLCGYNTALDLAGCRTPAILVPFDEHGEREQLIRARRLAAAPGFTMMRAAELTPGRLGAAAEAAAAGPARPPLALARDGGAEAARRILALAERTAPA